MTVPEVQLPSNKKFGFFFAFMFGVAALYSYTNALLSFAYIMCLISAVFVVVTIFKANALFPLNKLWMRFGLILGMIVGPIVLGVIFFGIFTPMAVMMRMSGRDELRLKLSNKTSHWISRIEPIEPATFKRQF